MDTHIDRCEQILIAVDRNELQLIVMCRHWYVWIEKYIYKTSEIINSVIYSFLNLFLLVLSVVFFFLSWYCYKPETQSGENMANDLEIIENDEETKL